MQVLSFKLMLKLLLALALGTALLVFAAPTARGQDASSVQTSARALAVNETAAKEAKPAAVPVFKEYRGVVIGMKADEVRSKLNDYIKSKTDGADMYLFSGGETALVYYDAEGKVTALSVDFPAKSAKAPSAKEVLGEEIQAKDDGSMYSLVRYPEAGYWVAYSRTGGDSPLVTVTIQKMR